MVPQEALLPVEVFLDPSNPDDNRRQNRRFHCGPATLGRLVLGRPGNQNETGWILNLSTKGAGLLLPVTLLLHMEFLLQINSADGARRYELRSQVCHATRQNDEEWLIGCEFVSPLTEDDLDILL